MEGILAEGVIEAADEKAAIERLKKFGCHSTRSKSPLGKRA